MSNTSRKSKRINSAQVSTVAAVGVARALAARQAQLQTLSAAEIEQVSGGLGNKLDFTIAGGRLADILAKSISARQDVVAPEVLGQDLGANLMAAG